MHFFSPYSVPITDQSDQGLTHQVYDVHLHEYVDGRLPAVCGATIIPAPMASPLGRPCRECETRIAHIVWDVDAARPGIRQRFNRTIRRLLKNSAFEEGEHAIQPGDSATSTGPRGPRLRLRHDARSRGPAATLAPRRDTATRPQRYPDRADLLPTLRRCSASLNRAGCVKPPALDPRRSAPTRSAGPRCSRVRATSGRPWWRPDPWRNPVPPAEPRRQADPDVQVRERFVVRLFQGGWPLLHVRARCPRNSVG
jgi:hypothetical protein